MVFHIFGCLRPRKLEDDINDQLQDDNILQQEDLQQEDRISELPNDILVHIVSLLPQKEAARTRILSKHWQEIQLFCVRFDFDSQVIFGPAGSEGIPKEMAEYRSWIEWRKIHMSEECRSEERRKYVEWVNKVLRSARNNATAIDEFRIQFDLAAPSREEIDEWLSYAFAKKVKRLELDLLMYGKYYSIYGKLRWSPYGFPSRFRLGLLDPSGGRFLRSLILRAVKVSTEDVTAFLQTFRVLEFLEVCQSETLSRVKVYGPSLVLKHLSVTLCGIVSMIIRDTHSLVSLQFDEFMYKLEVENAPNLVHARLPGFQWVSNKVDSDGQYCTTCLVLPNHPSSFLSRLQVLTLDADSCVHITHAADQVIHVPPQLTELKQLNFNATPYQSFIYLTSLVNELPRLEKLVFKFRRLRNEVCRRTKTRAEGLDNFRLQKYLKIAEFHGYAGRLSDDDFVRTLLEKAVALQTLTIRPRMNEFAKKAAMQLKRSVNHETPSLEFLIS